MLQLLDAHHWVTPTTIGDAHVVHHALLVLLVAAGQLHHGDRLARLLAIRLETFLAHWRNPPTQLTLPAFRRDVRALVRHDIPRLRRLLEWGVIETRLPEQRTPRLGVVTLGVEQTP